MGPAANSCPTSRSCASGFAGINSQPQTLTSIWTFCVFFNTKQNTESSCLLAAQSGASSDTGSFLYSQMLGDLHGVLPKSFSSSPSLPPEL